MTPRFPNHFSRHALGAYAVPMSCLVLVVLSGCASQRLPERGLPEAAVPSQWTAVAAAPGALESAETLALWWQRFNDGDFSSLVLQALQANTDVRTAQATLRQSRTQRDAKAAGLQPRVNASTSAQTSRVDAGDATDNFQAGFDASWEPDVFGALGRGVDAAGADVQASQASLGQVRVSIAAEVAVTYINLRGLQARLSIARRNLAAQMEVLQIVRWRSQAGLVSSLDVEQAVAASAQTAAQIPALVTTMAQNLSSLALLTGQPLQALRQRLRVDADAAAVVPQAPPNLALAIPAETLRQRADVQAAEYRVAAALARASQADAARYPSFKISGSVGLRALTLGTLTNGASVAQALLAAVSVPVFDGGAARAQVRVQEAALEQARVGYEGAVRSALKDVEDALVALQGDRERLTHLQSAAGAAANAELLARHRYASGLVDFATVLDTQRTLLATQDSVQTTLASLSADHVRLYKAMGGGWTPEAEIAAP
jgi:multidrug efflux system outer membrane protein